MEHKKAEQLARMEANVYAHGTMRKQGLIVLLIKRHNMAKFLKSVPATKQGKADMKAALKRDRRTDAYNARVDIEEYKALGHLYFEIEKAQNVNVGLANASKELSVYRALGTDDVREYKKHPLVKQAVKIYTDEHAEENTL